MKEIKDLVQNVGSRFGVSAAFTVMLPSSNGLRMPFPAIVVLCVFRNSKKWTLDWETTRLQVQDIIGFYAVETRKSRAVKAYYILTMNML